MARELEGNVAVVTGAASGIGLASTDALLAAGARVVLVDRDDAALAAICSERGDAAIPLVIDLLDPRGTRHGRTAARERLGKLFDRARSGRSRAAMGHRLLR
jgi:ribitol 2-dehydrogenase